MSRSLRVYLLHILEETTYLLETCEGLNKQDILNNATFQRSFVRSLEVIGEATKNLPEDFRQRHPHIPWRRMAGMRDKLIHDYFGVDYDIVWDVVVHQIPELHDQIETLIQRIQINE
ncbi:MAG: hypothetical protein B0A82_08965 [Alkalinema sp. CACIAM 70d]|nr:MAG: hypothetical protein B0A82_08965 [Alkalinema sp. CACIAM 70d]